MNSFCATPSDVKLCGLNRTLVRWCVLVCASGCHNVERMVFNGSGILRLRSGLWECVSVAAAFCFVFIVGGLCPGSWAAPVGRQAQGRMDRTKRSELPIWRNPCGTELDVDKRGGAKVEMDPRAAGKVHKAAHNVLEGARDYQDLLATEKQTQDFSAAVAWNAQQRSKLNHPWFQLPDKSVGEPLDVSGRHKEYYEQNLENLPAMYKYLELLLGALEKVPAGSKFSNSDNPDLRAHLDNTLFKMRGLLCEFDALLLNRGIKKLPSVEPAEVPERSDNDTVGGLEDFLVFRDILNFLEIMVSIFQEMSSSGH